MATTLMVVSLLFSMAVLLSSQMTAQLQLCVQMDRQQALRNAADSVVAQAIAGILADFNFGTKRETLTAAFPMASTQATLTFNPSRAGVPVSINNFEGLKPQAGWGGMVAVNGVSLVGAASNTTRGGTPVLTWCVLALPNSPYDIAASGPFKGTQALVVTGTGTPPSGGSILSNSVASDAISLDAGTLVTGDVHAAGGLVLQQPLKIMGSIISHGASQPLPNINVALLDPIAQGRTGVAELAYGGQPTALGLSAPLAGFNHSDAALTINSDLRLDGSVLYVNGDLTVNGSITGKGAVIASGRIVVKQAARMQAIDQLALIAGGDLTLNGSGRDSSFIRGLIYTGGNFVANDIALLGTFVANGGSSAQSTVGGAISFNNSAVQTDGSLSSISLVVAGQTTGSGTTLWAHGSISNNYEVHYAKAPGNGSATAQVIKSMQAGQVVYAVFDPTTHTWISGLTQDQLITEFGRIVCARLGRSLFTPVCPAGWGSMYNDLAGLPLSSPPSGSVNNIPAQQWTLTLDSFVDPSDRLGVILWRSPANYDHR
jgi:cytoskeletal protein CcmA (bactofilin family)